MELKGENTNLVSTGFLHLNIDLSYFHGGCVCFADYTLTESKVGEKGPYVTLFPSLLPLPRRTCMMQPFRY